MKTKAVSTIDAYIALYPKEAQAQLRKMRSAVRKAAPQATEAIKYGIPTLVLNGNLIHFGAYDTHIGFYPGANGIHVSRQELAQRGYELSKGTVRFPIDKPLPLALITKIVKFRIKENLAKSKNK